LRVEPYPIICSPYYYVEEVAVAGGSTVSTPSLAIDSSGTLHLVVRGADNGIWQNSKPSGGSWVGWDSPGGTTSATPAVVAGSKLFVIVLGAGGGIWFSSRSLGTSSWSALSPLGITTSQVPVLSTVS